MTDGKLLGCNMTGCAKSPVYVDLLKLCLKGVHTVFTAESVSASYTCF